MDQPLPGLAIITTTGPGPGLTNPVCKFLIYEHLFIYPSGNVMLSQPQGRNIWCGGYGAAPDAQGNTANLHVGLHIISTINTNPG